MKKGWLSLTLTALMVLAPLAVLTCHCFLTECGGGVAGAVASSHGPSCHHAAGTSGTAKGARAECCGKCQIEKAALSINKVVESVILRITNAAPVSYDAESFLRPSSFRSPHFFSFRGPPDPFFTRHILNTTFALRGPPAGLFCL